MKLFPTFLILAACALLLPAPGLLNAQTPAWTPLGPFGGTVRSLTASSMPGVVYATADTGVFLSLRSGTSWTPVFAGNVTGNLAVDPVQPSILYVVAQPGPVWKSVDSGAHWFQANRSLVGPGVLVYLAVDPASHNRIYAALDVGVALSTDGGASWRPANRGLTPGLPVTEVVAVRRPAGTAFAATAAGLFRTTNGARSWSLIPARSGLPQAPVERLAAAPSDPRTLYALIPGRGLYRTRNGGSSWNPGLQPPSPDGRVLALAVDPRSPEILYAGVPGGLFRSRDGARSWSALPATLGSTTAVAPDPTVRGRIYAGFAAVGGAFIDGIFRSDDGGTTWQRRNQGFAALEATGMDVALDDPDALWTTTYPQFLFRSVNGGQRWQRTPFPTSAIPDSPGGVAAVSSSSAFVQSAPLFPSNGSLWRTDNAGTAWERLLDGSSPTVLATYRLAPSDPAVVYAAVSGGSFSPAYGLLRSMDRGDSWEVRSSLTLALSSSGLAVAPSDASTLYVIGAVTRALRIPKVLRSRDGGTTFTDVSAGLPTGVGVLAAVAPNDPDVVYLVLAGPSFLTTNGVWKTEDGGATWRQASDDLLPQYAGQVPTELLATSVPDRVYAAMGNQVFRTDDGGESWRDVTANLTALAVNELASSLNGPGLVYAATTNGVWVLETD
jgi:photosystem II stability/assembly factor-like uncharacterized protein